MSKEQDVKYTISKHAKERYAARILGRETMHEIQSYIASNEEKIYTNIVKMITYGSMIYSGKQAKNNSTNYVQVYLNGCWIVLVDLNTNNVITLYKIDLGCGDEFNAKYIELMMQKVDDAKNRLSTAQLKHEKEVEEYKDIIAANTQQINEYRTYIKNLEASNDAYKTLIENSTADIMQASVEVSELINGLIGKKSF